MGCNLTLGTEEAHVTVTPSDVRPAGSTELDKIGRSAEQGHMIQHARGQDLEQTQLQQHCPGEMLTSPRNEPSISTITTNFGAADSSSATEVVPGTRTTSNDALPTLLSAAEAQSGVEATNRKDIQAGRLAEAGSYRHDDTDVTAPSPGRYHFPPALASYASRHRQRFDRAPLLPDKNLPFNQQIMAHIKDWAHFGSTVENDTRRKEILDRVFDTYQRVWFEALRIGYDPGLVDKAAQSALQTSPKTAATQRRNHLHPGRPPTFPRARQRKDVDPTKVPILESKSYKDSHRWAVTAGELQEARVSEEQIRKRASADLGPGEKLLEEVLENLGREIGKEDWFRVTEVTDSNPWGRDLFLYSLFEVQMSAQNLEKLRQLYAGFTQRIQKDNTQRRIDEEQERRNLFLALALEINDRDSSSRSSSPDAPQGSDDEISAAESDVPKNAQNTKSPLEVVIEISELVVNETDLSNLMALFPTVGVSEDDLADDAIVDGHSSHLDKAKHTLGDILLSSRQIHSLSQEAEQGGDFEVNIKYSSQIEELHQKIAHGKHILWGLLPFLKSDWRFDQEREVSDGPVDEMHQDEHAGPVDPLSESQSLPQSTFVESVETSVLPEPSKGPIKRALVSTEDEAGDDGCPSPKKQKTDKNEEKRTDDHPRGLVNEVTKPQPADNNDAPSAPQDSQPSSSLSTQPSAEHTASDVDSFIKACILPKANQLLMEAGRRPINFTTWSHLRAAVEDAGVPMKDRVGLSLKMVKGRKNGWKIEEQDRLTALHHESSGPPVSAESRRRPGPLVVSLRLPKAFNPEDLTSERVFRHKGFTYRYTRSSTLAQRASMDEPLDTFIRYWLRPGPGVDGNWRFGKYEALTHPDDPDRTTIIHGIWDDKGGNPVQGAEWFYEGNGEWQPEPATTPNPQDEHDDDDDHDDSAGQDTPTPGKSSLVNKHLKNVIRLRRDSASWTVSTNDKHKSRKKQASKDKPKSGTGRSSKTKPSPLSQSTSAATGSTRAGSSSRSAPTRSSSTSGQRGRGKQRRRSVAKKSLIELGDGGSSDEDYCPSS